MRSPVLTSMSYSRGGWVVLDGIGQMDQLVGGLAHGADHGHHIGALPARAGDVVGHGPDPVGIADRGPPELLHHQRHPAEAQTAHGPDPRLRCPVPAPRRPGPRTARPARANEGAPRMGRVCARAQREESPPARGARGPPGRRGPGRKRRQRMRNGIIVAVVAGVIVAIAFVVSGGNNNRRSPADRRRPPARQDRADARLQAQANKVGGQGRMPGEHQDDGQHQKYSAAPAMTIDTTKNYTATVKTTAGTFVIALDAKARPRPSTTSCSWPTRATTTA